MAKAKAKVRAPVKKTPVRYSPELAARLCERIADGESMRAVCAGTGMPARRTVYEWLAGNEDFMRRYALAKQSRAHDVFDDMERIEQALESGEIDPNAARVILDSRKWRLARIDGRYTDKAVAVDVLNVNTGPVKGYMIVSPEDWPDATPSDAK